MILPLRCLKRADLDNEDDITFNAAFEEPLHTSGLVCFVTWRGNETGSHHRQMEVLQTLCLEWEP